MAFGQGDRFVSAEMVDLKAGSARYTNIKDLKGEKFADWLQSEIKYWSELLSMSTRNDSRLSPLLSNVINTYIHDLQQIEPDKGKTLFPNKKVYSEVVSANSAARLPMHDDKHAEEFRLSFLTGMAMPVVFAYRSISDLMDDGFLRGYNKGVDANFEQFSKSVENSLEDVKTAVEESSEDIKLQLDVAAEKISSLAKAATSAIALSEPVKFWEQRRDIHKENAKRYSKYAVISACVFAAVLFLSMLYGYAAGVTHIVWGYEITLPKTLAGFAVILLVSTGGVWATRIFVKLMMVNLTSEAESLERSTMIKTFVAMQAVDSSISHESQMLFYTTLFRPSNNTINEESTAPEYGKILEAVLKSKSPEK